MVSEPPDPSPAASPPARCGAAVAAPGPAALAEWREDGGGPRLPALLLAAACVCAAGGGATKEKGEAGATWWRVACLCVRVSVGEKGGTRLARRKPKVKRQLSSSSSSTEEDDEP